MIKNKITLIIHDEKIKRTKSEICKELGIEIMIDDIYDYASELAENGIKTFLLTKPWNEDKKINSQFIQRVYLWDEIII